jgi:hypothetical protein
VQRGILGTKSVFALGPRKTTEHLDWELTQSAWGPRYIASGAAPTENTASNTFSNIVTDDSFPRERVSRAVTQKRPFSLYSYCITSAVVVVSFEVFA